MEEAFRTFVTDRSRALCRMAFLMTGDWQRAEDLVQEALVRVYERRERLRDVDALEPYTRRVLVTIFLGWRARRWNAEQPVEHLPEGPTADSAGTAEDRDLTWRAILRLPRQQRAAVVLRFYEDMTEQDIAAVLGCSPGAVKSHLHRALARLRADTSLTRERTR